MCPRSFALFLFFLTPPSAARLKGADPTARPCQSHHHSSTWASQMSENEVELSSPPTDGVSALAFCPHGRLLAATSWDSQIHLYRVNSADLVTSLPQPSPLLDCAFLDGGKIVSGATDGALRLHDFESDIERVLGRHANGVRCVGKCAAVGAVVTGSWDRSIKIWDARTSEACIGTYAQPDKVFAMCAGVLGANSPSIPLLVVATASRHVRILDLRKPSDPLQIRESALKCQTRAVAQMTNNIGYAMGSVEGRVAVEYFDADPNVQKKRYAFKCHRTPVGGEPTQRALQCHQAHDAHCVGLRQFSCLRTFALPIN